MAKRKSTSKKVRFEVFKRDKFTCQYCGKKSPNVILHIDHIEPVSKGGKNDILNLLTSCNECNSGKSDIRLSDDSALEKQRKQLEDLEERREQISLMLQWRESLSDLKSDTLELIADYIDNKLGSFSLNETGIRNIEALLKKHGLAEILEAIDISADKYLRYDVENKLTKESVETFVTKIGGILTLKNLPPIRQKLSYIKGICRNRFNYWDDRKGSIILNEYVKALESKGWDEKGILYDLENEVIEKTKQANNWTEWRNLIDGWTEDIKTWDENEHESIEEDDVEYTVEEIKEMATNSISVQRDILTAISHIGEAFEDFDREAFEYSIFEHALKFLEVIRDRCEDSSSGEKYFSTWSYIHRMGLEEYFKINSAKKSWLDDAAKELIHQFLSEINLDELDGYKNIKDIEIFIAAYKNGLTS